MNLRQYQVDLIDDLTTAAAQGHRRIICQAWMGSGKCLGKGTPVLLFDGSIKPVEEIHPGDLLMGPDSKYREVLSTSKGYGKLYEIVPQKGRSWVCNEDHILTLVHTETDKISDISVKSLINMREGGVRRRLLQFQTGVDFQENHKPLPLDPYFFGVWLGDGNKNLSSVGITTADKEIKNLCEKVADEFGLKIRAEDSGGIRCPTYYIHGKHGGIWGKSRTNDLLEKLRMLWKKDGGIPKEYLVSSRKNRLALLAGLLDTDGHLARGYFEFVQKLNKTADAVEFLAASLGFKTSRSIKYIKGTAYNRISISGEISTIPTRILRKRAKPRPVNWKDALRTSIKIKELGNGEYFGFTLNGDGRFLLGDFTVTHNTVVAAHIIRHAVSNGKRVLFLAHRRELVLQALEKVGLHFGVDTTAMMAGDEYDNTQPVVVASVQTLHSWCLKRKHTRPPKADLIIHDECHHVPSKTNAEIHALYPDAIILGLTATPITKSGKGLKAHFDVIVKGPTIKQLTEEGYLVPCKYIVPSLPDLSKLKIQQGDYVQGELERRMDKPELVGDITRNWVRFALGKKTLVFASGVKHSQNIVRSFKECGIDAEHLDAHSPKEHRDEVLKRFKEGNLTILSNVGLFTEGTDIPAAQALIFARPTKSECLYLQVAGRILRTHPSKQEAIILDHAGVVYQFGRLDREWEWTLEFNEKVRREKINEGKKKREKLGIICKKCCAYYEPVEHHSMECPSCGAIPEMKGKPIRVYEAWLKELDDTDPKPGTINPRDFYRMLLGHAISRGYKPGWAAWSYKQKFGKWPGSAWKRDSALTPSIEVKAYLRERANQWLASKNITPNFKDNKVLTNQELPSILF